MSLPACLVSGLLLSCGIVVAIRFLQVTSVRRAESLLTSSTPTPPYRVVKTASTYAVQESRLALGTQDVVWTSITGSPMSYETAVEMAKSRTRLKNREGEDVVWPGGPVEEEKS